MLTKTKLSSDDLKKGTTVKLLHSPGIERWEEFTCLSSLRDVEPTVKFIISDGGLDGPETDEDEQPEGNT